MRGILILAVIAVSLGGARMGIAGIDDAMPETPRVLYYLHTTWYPIHKNAKAQPLGKRLKEQIAREQWGDAIKSAEALSALMPEDLPDYKQEHPWERRASIAELYLFGGDREVGGESE